ncbi:MAG: hypothetical protein EB127_17335, partial [Alphaproteobacteria bacterium]|nr:hypothetical protein [Alphaproteobacteria bacterium]
MLHAGQLGRRKPFTSPEHEKAKLLNFTFLPRNARIDTPNKQKGNKMAKGKAISVKIATTKVIKALET